MAYRRPSLRRIREILRLKFEAGLSKRAIALTIGVSRLEGCRPHGARLRADPLRGQPEVARASGHWPPAKDHHGSCHPCASANVNRARDS